MPLLPPNPLIIDSPLSADEALARLRAATGAPRWVRFRAPATPFEGEVTGHEFRIRRAINYQNSWLPRIRGHVEPRAEGCQLTARMSLHPLVMLFMLAWFGAVLAFAVPGLLLLLRAGDPGLLAFDGMMLLFGGGLSLGAYGYEANAARDRLTALLGSRRTANLAPRGSQPTGGRAEADGWSH
jgi:hypothetical protein